MKLKRLVVDGVLERLMPMRGLESYMTFCATRVVRIRKPFIIGVTGSVGKSTTTAMIEAVLSRPEVEQIVGRCGCTVGNMNDDVGVPATLLRFDRVFDSGSLPWGYVGRLAMLVETTLRTLKALTWSYPRVMVLECGAGWTGHLQRVGAITRPSVCVVTTIGAAHLERLRTLEGVAHEKGELVRAVPPSGLVVLGQDHEYVSVLERMASAPVVRVSGEGLELSTNIARAVCRHLGVPAEITDAALRDFKRLSGRLNLLKLPSMTIIDDTYNANPLSMKLGLDTLAATAASGRRLAVLGAMGELGEEAARYHEEVGAYARSRVDVLIGVGDLARHYSPDHWFDTSDACAERIGGLVREGDYLLVKGSASARMKQIVEKLGSRPGKAETCGGNAGAV